MDSCLAVEREVDKILAKFTGLNGHSEKLFDELITSIRNIQNELSSGEYLPL